METSLQKSILKELAEYRATEGFCAIPYFSKFNLGKLAVKIFSMPASTQPQK